ncbi:MAG: DUF72 domain-containing protein [Phenylobacterium sp.]|nr:MAG: DUF72 domain-containing protein [Phenylobacterium sp.]
MAETGIRIGTAGWAIPRAVADAFPREGSGLQRYAGCFQVVEINSTFYRPHQASTFERWAETTPEGFRFALKAPRAVTHEAKLAGGAAELARFLEDGRRLGAKFAVVLVQLPPSLAFDADVAGRFFAGLRDLAPDLALACEPRHASWFEPQPDALLAGLQVARVAADPARHPAAAEPGGWRGFAYHRLHGSPRMYYSSYADGRLERLAERLRAGPADSWCIFDNTASGAAAADALQLRRRLGGRPQAAEDG